MDQGVYLIQLSQWAFRQTPESIVAKGTLNNDQVDIAVSAVLTYKNGGKATISASCREDWENKAVIKGTKGSVVVFKTKKLSIHLGSINFYNFFLNKD